MKLLIRAGIKVKRVPGNFTTYDVKIDAKFWCIDGNFNHSVLDRYHFHEWKQLELNVMGHP